MSIIEEARKHRAMFLKLREDATDATASSCVELFPSLKYDSSLVPVGTRINWNGVIKRAAVDLWDTVANNPDNAPSLWESIEYREGYRVIPETMTVGTAFANGERGWWMDSLYESVMDGNVWTPEEYPNGWKEVKEDEQ